MSRKLWRNRVIRSVVLLVALFVLLGAAVARAQPAPALSPNVSVFATGLNDPRGLKFGPDGNLYVAEAGTGGTDSTVGLCQQLPTPYAPVTNGKTARISRISAAGQRTTVVDGLPSSQTAVPDLIGVADVAFIGQTLYGLVAGGGCQKGSADVPNGVVRINQDGTWTLIANISAFVQNNPVQQLPPGDYIAEGEPYSMVTVDGDLYVVEANSGQLLRVTTGGQISRVSDLSVGHPVPAAVAYRDGRFYVGDLGVFPIRRGAVKIHTITPGGEKRVFAEGLTAILGLAFDRQGQLYALETANVDNQGPQPGTGRVVRVTSSGLVEVASGLTFPTGMTMGPDGNLYVSHCGYCFEPGKGELVRINLQSDPGMPLPETSVEGAPVTFPETGYSLEGDFLAYWRENGGLPVFGYPIDSARQVDSQVAQWLERVRLELHPANAAPYRVLLSRLGVEALARQGVDWQGLPKASPSAPHYFKATGHAITYGPFWSYWASHGLEFDGRAGSSYAESLALFGYPISEATMERNASGALVLTQWFERARFEYHPNNSAAYRVLLGRLGAEVRAVQKR